MSTRNIEAVANATEAEVALIKGGSLNFAGICFQRDINALVFRDPATGSLIQIPIGAGVAAAGTAVASAPLVAGAAKQIDTVAIASLVVGADATPGAAGQYIAKIAKKAIPDAAATAVFTVTLPNANHAVAIRIILLASIAAVADQFESSRVAAGTIVAARTTGANAVATAVALTGAGIATVAGGETITLAYGVSAIGGAVGAVNTFDITVTITRAGGTGTHQVVAFVELINAEASGVTIAAA